MHSESEHKKVNDKQETDIKTQQTVQSDVFDI